MNRESISEHRKARERGALCEQRVRKEKERNQKQERKRFITREKLYVLVNDRQFRSRGAEKNITSGESVKRERGKEEE